MTTERIWTFQDILKILWGQHSGYIVEIPFEGGARDYDYNPNIDEDLPVDITKESNFFFSALAFDGAPRTKQCAIKPHYLWADLDPVDPRTLEIKPSIAWSTSDEHYQGIWLLSNFEKATKEQIEQMNKRLTYQVRADTGCWDLARLLRIPGSVNAKRFGEVGKILWVSPGTLWDYRKLDSLLMEVQSRKTADDLFSDESYPTPEVAEAIREKWWTSIRESSKQDLCTTEAKAALKDRSVVLWRLTKSLVNSNIPHEDILAILLYSPWNKFKGRGDELYRMKETIGSAVNFYDQPLKVNKYLDTEDYTERVREALASDIPVRPDNPYRFKTVRELSYVPGIKYAVNPLFYENSFNVVFGSPGCGKTFFILDVALSIAAGIPWQGEETISGPVAYIAGEGEQGLYKRITAWQEARGAIPHEFYSLSPMPQVLNGDLQFLVQAIADLPRKPKMLVVDTLARAMAGGDENDTSDMSRLVGMFDKLRTELTDDGVIVMIHHSGKDPTKGPRGNSALPAAVDSMIFVQKSKQQDMMIKSHKDKEAKGFEDFEMRSRTFGKEGSESLVFDKAILPPEDSRPPTSFQRVSTDDIHRKLSARYEGVEVSRAEIIKFLEDNFPGSERTFYNKFKLMEHEARIILGKSDLYSVHPYRAQAQAYPEGP